ncbi:pyridoxamine 5'-phosphate oxidase family protein [Pedobacter nototheniae]|uniref:pyridoxamine 5'-phosphate oxidase family protein n=1 Tax=Pedobacter nototheniae TaxID=2488994 RepID=UPI002931DC38|nr:pyridoxamine 5'-phosphate oxidase family protein [Pedobacter nototheniae]
MKNEKNISILKEMAESVRICMFTTFSANDEFGSRPMGTAKIEDDGSIWFYTNEYSPKSKEISKENNVLLAYSDPSKNTYLTVKGKASIVDDKVRKEAYWSPFIKAWFPDGIEDPRLILIKITPEEAEYWDASSSKLVVLFSTLKALVTGEQPDLGKHDTMKF